MGSQGLVETTNPSLLISPMTSPSRAHWKHLGHLVRFRLEVRAAPPPRPPAPGDSLLSHLWPRSLRDRLPCTHPPGGRRSSSPGVPAWISGAHLEGCL